MTFLICSKNRILAYESGIAVTTKGNKVVLSINGEQTLLSSVDVDQLIAKLKDAQENLVSDTDYTEYARFLSVSPAVLVQLEKWHKKYVPATGTAPSVGGNLVRNVELIIYRYFNDGDMVGIRGRDPYKIVNRAASSALNAMYSIAQALGIETYSDKDFINGTEVLSVKITNESSYRKSLGILAKYTVYLLSHAEHLDVFQKRAITRAKRRSNFF